MMLPTHCATVKLKPCTKVHFLRPDAIIATVTAGLKCAPETSPSEKIITVNAAAMDQTNGTLVKTFSPTVRTSMYVPRNSLTRAGTPTFPDTAGDTGGSPPNS